MEWNQKLPSKLCLGHHEVQNTVPVFHKSKELSNTGMFWEKAILHIRDKIVYSEACCVVFHSLVIIQIFNNNWSEADRVRVDSGSDDLNYLGHLGHVLSG